MSTVTHQKTSELVVAALEGASSAVSNKIAFEKVLKTGLPGKKNEEYRFTPVSLSLEKNSQKGLLINEKGTSLSTGPSIANAAKVLFINGLLSAAASLPKGVSLTDQSPSEQSDAFGTLNEAFRKKIFSLKASGHCEQVLHIHHECTSQEQATLSFPAIHISLEAESELTVIETFSINGNGYHLSVPVMQIEVGAKSVCHYLRIQDCTGNIDQVYNSLIRQKEDSIVHAFILTTEGNIIRNNFTLEIDGERAEGNLMGLYLLNGKTLADNHTVVDHRLPNANSNEMFKGVMQGTSKGVFNGKIFVRQDAQKTNAFQSNRNIVLSESASVNTKPQLEIWADDVKCSHGCTTGQMDDEALFYLESRGIDKPTAQSMLLDAFAGEVIEKISSESLREFVREAVLKKIQSLK